MHNQATPMRAGATTRHRRSGRKPLSVVAVLSLFASLLGVILAAPAGAQSSDLEIVKTSEPGPSCPAFNAAFRNFFPFPADGNAGFVGAPFTYCYVIFNNNTTDPIFNVSVTDDNATPTDPSDDFVLDLIDPSGAPLGPSADLPANGLAYATHTTSFSVPELYTNKAVVTGNTAADNSGIQQSNEDITQILIFDVTVEKVADQATVDEGDPVTFTFTMTNNSGFENYTLTALNDSVFGDLTQYQSLGQGDCTLTQVILPTKDYSCQITVPLDDPGTHSNTFTAVGEGPDGTPVGGEADAEVIVNDTPASIELVKSADLSEVPASGADVTFTIEVTNTSAVDSVDINQITDTIYGNLNAECNLVDAAGTATPITLAAGASTTCTFVRTVSSADGPVHNNVATATGTSDDGDPVAADDDEEITVENDEVGSIRVRKRSNITEVPESGGDVDFRFRIRNMSATVDVTLTELVDDTFGDISVECGIDDAAGNPAPIELAPNEEHECTITRFLSGDVGTPHRNRVTAEAQDENGNDLDDRANQVVNFIDEVGSISIDKTANPTTVPATGGPVDFTFVVTNNSPVDDVFFGTLIDDVYGDISNECGFTPPVTIAPGASATCTITRVVSAAPATSGGGTSNYTGTPPSVSNFNYVIDEPTPPPCSGQQWQTNGVRMGSFQGYALLVITGMTLAPGTWAVDDFTSWDADIDRPDYPQDHEIVRIEFWKNSQRVAVSNATQDLPDGFVSAIATGSLGTVNLPNGADQVRIVHSNLFQGTVGTNSLDPVSLCMVRVSPPLDLTPHVNTVEGCGEDDDGQTLCAGDDATVEFDDTQDDGPSSIKVTKSANKSTITSGQTARFTFTVQNTSANDTVTITSMTDSVYGNVAATCNLPRVLAPGQTMTCQMVRGVSGPAGTNHYNVLNVSGMDDDGGPVGGSDDTTIALTGSYRCRGGTATWWKNYSQFRWPNGIRHNTPVEPNLTPTYANYNWLQAVSLPGNNSAAGIRRHLIREASAAILNELATPPAYPVSSVNVIQAAVNNALAQGSPTEMWRIARILFSWNRSMCNN